MVGSMSADLHLYSLENTDENRRLLATMASIDAIGDDFGDDFTDGDGKPFNVVSNSEYEDLTRRIYGPGWSNSNVWIGQVSWMKAGLLADSEPFDRYVPASVLRVQTLTSGHPVLTPGLAREITVAMNLPNRSIYGRHEYVRTTDPHFYGGNGPVVRHGSIGIQKTRGSRGVAPARKVKAWLGENIGRVVFPGSL